jgi:hypothetical protein
MIPHHKIQVIKDSESEFSQDATMFIISYDLCHRIQDKIGIKHNYTIFKINFLFIILNFNIYLVEMNF